mgnify:CR=1 FL=1
MKRQHSHGASQELPVLMDDEVLISQCKHIPGKVY